MSSRSVNKVTLIGNLTRDPELKYTPQGTAVCTFGLATNRSWTTKTGETKEDVQFHRVVAWQKLAELADQLLSKGRKVFLEGRITYRQFEGKDGTQKNITEIVMDDFVIFDDRHKGDYEEDAAPAKPAAPKRQEASKDEDDDIPVDESTEEDSVEPDDIPF